ncbi:MAG: NADP-dependent phosphogluconate dehydrogenase [Acidobacteria bacterium]|nr:NADP-dependent phosphogluconate dehydrogenase [Acidobacteriota bacterium]
MIRKTKAACQIGMYGLGPMGRSLALNFADHGYSVATYNITADLTWQLMNVPGLPSLVTPFFNEKDFVAGLKQPRTVMIMVKSGAPVDEVLDRLLPLLDPGDVIIEGGNSDFRDTARRLRVVNEKGVMYIGSGVSGGEEGARRGPSLMPGGNVEAWPVVREMLQSIAARNPKGQACCEWIGPEGAGHFVKTHHNGIEYGVMQVIGEVCWILRAMGMTNDEIADAMDGWNVRMKAFLLEITSEVLRARDDDGSPLLDHVLDVAGAKGTGAGTVVSALDLGQSVNILAAGVAARLMSTNRKRRIEIHELYQLPEPKLPGDPKEWTAKLGQALEAAFALAYAQGFTTLEEASLQYNWKLNLPQIASIWGGGCIIRADILNEISAAFVKEPMLDTLLVAPAFVECIRKGVPALREAVSAAVLGGLPVPALNSALSNFDSMRSPNLVSASVIALLRDLFGAHTFKRNDRPGAFHRNWGKV